MAAVNDCYVVLYEEQMEHGPDRTVYGLFSSIDDARRWISLQMKCFDGDFSILPLRLLPVETKP